MKKIRTLSVLILLVVAMAVPIAMAAPPYSKTVQAHGQCTDIWVGLWWLYDGGPLVDGAVSGPWQVTAQPVSGKAEFNAAVKTSEGIIKFELVRVDSVTLVDSILTITGAIEEKYRGYSFVFEDSVPSISGTKITIDLDGETMDLDLNNNDNNLLGTVKSGGAHP